MKSKKLTSNEEKLLIDKANELIDDLNKQPFWESMSTGVCDIEICGQNFQLQVILNSDEDERLGY